VRHEQGQGKRQSITKEKRPFQEHLCRPRPGYSEAQGSNEETLTSPLDQQVFDNMTMYVGQAKTSSLVTIGQQLMVDSK